MMTAGLNFIQVPLSRPEESLAVATLKGLSRPKKQISSRFFYDVAGSRLFEQITGLPEYYLTRCETEILDRHSAEIVNALGADIQVVEFGSGSSEKTRILLRSVLRRQRQLEYVPIDISAEFLKHSSQELLDEVNRLRVSALAGDYLDAVAALPEHSGPRLFLFLGSTIGNFEQSEAVRFLRTVRRIMREWDRLLVGVDLHKSPDIIEPAYNDLSGTTELFNKNILARINRELCGHFDSALFEHHAPWVEEESRIEMRLVSTRDQVVTIDGLDRAFSFREGEYIHTENSHKWTREFFASMCAQAGLVRTQSWTDTKDWFDLNLLRREPAAE